ncbi:MAG: response regulator [Myxococcales bacterium FL481]|nr:MAG: response regulator [Myxococcales bacterium FL481]
MSQMHHHPRFIARSVKEMGERSFNGALAYAAVAVLMYFAGGVAEAAPPVGAAGLAVVLGLCTVRAVLAHRMRREVGDGRWQSSVHDGLVAALALAWGGTTAWIANHYQYGPETVLGYVALAALAAGGSTAFGIRPRTQVWFLASLFAPALVGTLLLPDALGFTVGTVVYLAFIYKDGRQSGNAWRKLVCTQLQLEEAEQRAVAAAEAKSVFLATMSHELRTPMHGVLGVSHLLADSDLNEDQRRLVATLQESGQNLLHLISDILDLSKLDAGRVELDPVAFSPRELLDHAMKPLQVLMTHGRLSWSTDCEQAWFTADAHRIRQVLNNLVGNAIKFTHHGEVTVRATTVESARGLRLQFEVRDTGIGIPPDKLDTIFEAFGQASPSTVRKYGGTGLGLAICARLVEQMGGEIGVDSEVGRGSRFWFSVAVERAAKVEQPVEATVDPASLPRLDVLVVEDNKVNQMLIRRLLERDRQRVTFAGTGEQALAIAQRQRFDLILMDLGLPDIGGLEVTREIRTRDSQTPIVALTGEAERPGRREMTEMGLTGWLTKPLDPERLRRTLLWSGSADAANERPAPRTESQRREPESSSLLGGA